MDFVSCQGGRQNGHCRETSTFLDDFLVQLLTRPNNLTSFGCCKMCTSVAMSTGVRGRQLQRQTDAGLLGNKRERASFRA